MIAKFEKVERDIDHSFYVKELNIKHFYSPVHFHPEIEILLVRQGQGTFFVGDAAVPFYPGYVALIGKNVPHVWLNSKEYYQLDSNLLSSAVYVQFDEAFMGTDVWRLPEFNILSDLLNKAKRGIAFKGEIANLLAKQMEAILEKKSFERLLLLWEILYEMATSSEFECLASPYFNFSLKRENVDRIGKIYDYINQNFHKDISLEAIAEVASMTPTAFCRYFKTHTNKTFGEFLAGFRIGYACKLLTSSEETVADIAYQSGFGSSSNFIRLFKRKMHMTPLQYRLKFQNSDN